MIECVGIKKNFKEVNAVKGVDFKIEDGIFLGLLGPNGAGKTTLLSMMIGLQEPSEGQIYFDGTRMSKSSIRVKSEIGVVSQHINLDKELSVRENMEFMGRLYHMKKDDIARRSKELLAFLGLDKHQDRLVKGLSGGMKRKLMIAKAVIHDPKYIFLDEPTVGIDVTYRREIWHFLNMQHREGKTLILTSHYIEEIEKLCDRVMLIDEGVIFKTNSPKEMILELGKFKTVIEHEDDNDMYEEVYFYPDLKSAKEAAENFDTAYHISRTSLEDVFFKYTSKKMKH